MDAKGRAAGEHVATRLDAFPPRDACGRSDAAAPERGYLLTGPQAAGCLDLGRLLRRAALRDGAAPGRTWVAVPAADAAAVCRFLRREKVRLPVAALAPDLLPDSLRPARLVYFESRAGPRSGRVLVAPDGAVMLDLLEAAPRDGAP